MPDPGKLDRPNTPFAVSLPILRENAIVPSDVGQYDRVYKMLLSGTVTSTVCNGKRVIPNLRQMAAELGIALKD